MKTSRMVKRKVKVDSGRKTYIDEDTGERIEIDMMLKSEEVDINFQKIWVAHILGAIDEISNKKVKLLFWLFQETSQYGSENIILKTGKEIAEATGISKPTIERTLATLAEHNIIVRRPGVIWINPDVIFKGTNGKRMNVMIRYQEQQLSLFDESDDNGNGESAAPNSEILPAPTDDDSRVRQETETLEEWQLSKAG